MLSGIFDRLLDRLLEEAKALYGARLITLAIYGSVARGVMRPDSDIDVLIVADPLPAGRLPRVREFAQIELRTKDDLAGAAAQGVHTFLSPLLKTPAEIGHGSPLFLDMTLEARILFDRDGFFAGYLERLRARMKTLGSVRKGLGDGYYWVLKPDLKPGEEIVL